MTTQAETSVDDVMLEVHATWAAVLKKDGLGLDDDLFAIGGNSVLAAHVMAGLSKKFGTRLPLRLLFANPTIRGSAQAIAAHLSTLVAAR